MGELLKEATTRLHAHRGRMTAQRRLILESLESLSDHPTAEELYGLSQQRDPSLNLSTVYRTLRWLEQENLVSPRLFSEERRQERFDTASPSEHHHFMCTQCKEVSEFDTACLDQIKAEFTGRTGSWVETGSIMLYGLCARCCSELEDCADNFKAG